MIPGRSMLPQKCLKTTDFDLGNLRVRTKNFLKSHQSQANL